MSVHLSQEDLDLVVLYALRYAFYRHSTAPSDCMMMATRYLTYLSDHVLTQIHKEVTEVIFRYRHHPGALDMACDLATWEELQERVAGEQARRLRSLPHS